MTTVKITKKDYFTAIKALCAGETPEISVEDIAAFCDKELTALDTRAARAKEKAAAKRAEGDELLEAVFAALTDEPATRQEITDRIEGDDISLAKVGYRLTSLVKAERAVKTEVAVTGEDGKTKRVAAYSLA